MNARKAKQNRKMAEILATERNAAMEEVSHTMRVKTITDPFDPEKILARYQTVTLQHGEGTFRRILKKLKGRGNGMYVG